eukprot:g2909.t1
MELANMSPEEWHFVKEDALTFNHSLEKNFDTEEDAERHAREVIHAANLAVQADLAACKPDYALMDTLGALDAMEADAEVAEGDGEEESENRSEGPDESDSDEAYYMSPHNPNPGGRLSKSQLKRRWKLSHEVRMNRE